MIGGNLTNEELAASRCTKAEGPTAGAGAGALVAANKSPAPSLRHWPPSTESRIVRVSRVFGGKDRHSKVRTVKGLRDRRVRLSVPTAIQLYDLQDRLGLSQPSKVVDWLLDAAQHEIDKLPPLQFPPQSAQDLVAHLPSSMVASFASGAADRAAAAAAAAAANTATAASAVMAADGNKRHCHGGIKGLMGLNSSVGLVNGAMPLAHGLYYTAGESWTNGNNSVHDQLVFYSPEGGGFAIKEAADHHFPEDNLDHSQGQLSLSSSARSFLHPGSQG
ncbi:hypothetical protein BS78_09G199800 [Paspalum vaginatum]|nr:hypothetical protein BS78_09G199800 [Paspalum vaginatum]KAJ1263620.1 hypothetical protein BS78_09G199800 [Paspalum vaginatum]